MKKNQDQYKGYKSSGENAEESSDLIHHQTTAPERPANNKQG